MKALKAALSIAELVAGMIFLLNAASDIQLGFGLVLFAMGLEGLIAPRLALRS